jgi:hypothetical protein
MEPITPKVTETQANDLGRESWKEMGQDLYQNLNQLWMKERQLVRVELNEKLYELKSASRSMAIGGGLLLVGLFSLIATATIVLDIFLELWLASAIVTGVFLFIGIIAFNVGKRKLEMGKLRPQHSIDALGEIKNTFQEKLNEFQKH